MNEKLTELAERCEAATVPDRELDADIALTQGWTEHPGDNWIGPHGEICVPEFTASLDAALTLVLDGMESEMTNLYGVARVAVGLNVNNGPTHGEHVCGSLCLALCAAALRARAALDAEQRLDRTTQTNGERQRQEEAARRALDDPEIKRAVHRKPQARI